MKRWWRSICRNTLCRIQARESVYKGIVAHCLSSMRCLLEVNVLQKCSHPNIIALEEHYYKYDHKDSALVFRAYDMDLRKLLMRRRDTPDEFPPEHRRKISSGLWTGLAYLHSVSIVHRDVNPANVMLRYGLTIQTALADMGLAADMSMPSSVAGDDGRWLVSKKN